MTLLCLLRSRRTIYPGDLIISEDALLRGSVENMLCFDLVGMMCFLLSRNDSWSKISLNTSFVTSNFILKTSRLHKLLKFLHSKLLCDLLPTVSFVSSSQACHPRGKPMLSCSISASWATSWPQLWRWIGDPLRQNSERRSHWGATSKVLYRGPMDIPTGHIQIQIWKSYV